MQKPDRKGGLSFERRAKSDEWRAEADTGIMHFGLDLFP